MKAIDANGNRREAGDSVKAMDSDPSRGVERIVNEQIGVEQGLAERVVVEHIVVDHISVCVCTYKRPAMLKRLLDELGRQESGGLFTYSVVVVDNDHLRSAEPVVSDFAAAATIPVRYCVEPRQNIALARNKAVENAEGDFIAFIDDDEFPIGHWLLTLYNTCNQYGVDGVLGPVNPHFDQETPTWVVKSKLHERPTYPTGLVIDWRKGRTGNVLLKSELFRCEAQPFNPEFLAGEDQQFFRRMIEGGHVFIWCNEAVAYEVVPPTRWKRSFMLRRAMLRGSMEPNSPTFGVWDVAKSVVAVPVYTVALPFASISGHHRFMVLAVRLSYHLGKLLALLGLHPVGEQHVTE
jgi:cellulose synthase/poly-beta-1,6-N-acetylglucosamine synthase-like glycosyltransferase